MLATVMSWSHWRHYVEDARFPVTVLMDHHNLQRFITTRALMGRQAKWWETLSGNDLNIVYRAGKKNPADAPSRRPDYMLGAPHAMLADASPAHIRSDTGDGSTTYSPKELHRLQVLCHLVVPAVLENKLFEQTLPDTLRQLVSNKQRSDPLAMEVRTALGLVGGSPDGAQRLTWAKKAGHRCAWSQADDGLLYRDGLLYMPPAGGARTEILRLQHDLQTAIHFYDKRSLNLFSRKYYWPGNPCDI